MTPDPVTSEYFCPHCSQVFVVATDERGTYECPHCRGEVTVPDEASMSRADEYLDSEHIRRLAKLRRAANRSRAYAVVAALACLATLLQSLLMAVRAYREGDLRWMIGWSLIAAVCVAGAVLFLHRARRLRAELSRPLPEPQIAPDFSTLGNGSQRWKALEDVV